MTTNPEPELGPAPGAEKHAHAGSAGTNDKSGEPRAEDRSRAGRPGAIGMGEGDAGVGGGGLPRTSTDRDEDRLARVALTWLVEPGNRTVWGLVQQGGAAATLDLLLRGDLPDGRLRAAAAARAAVGDARRFAEAALRRGEKLGARVVVPSDPEWPGRVADLARLELRTGGRVNQDTRPPLCFWVRGGLPLDEAFERSVAVVGARAATGYGTHVAGEMAYALADRGWTVVSGGAFGIDAAAHRGALAAGGRTVTVLACGVERPYPAGNVALFERIVECGLIVSEWPLGAEPLRHRFLIRNRVIAAATAGTVVVEAAARSGATQTMSRVLALSRPALVVPGPVTSAMSVGCHAILRGNPYARLVTSADDVLEEVGRIGEYLSERPRGPDRRRDALDEESALVLEAVPRRGTSTPEELAAAAGLDLRTVLRRLSLLELAGLVVRREDGIALALDAL
ncbi:putative DNA processing Smf-family protein [Actinoplanes missouriensis 431]|uniref:Putative DNA processing Smf-family protein n=2 Tax=Actinoplanes missouriensis TaxID=1866 RepID=I0HGU5_ACTM4|nr:putative DNA processing Smf-family protein [Actinoplanes missouriensis 431]